MIDAASQALEDGEIDAYSVECRAPRFNVTIGAGGEAWTGSGLSEEEAFYWAEQARRTGNQVSPPAPAPEAIIGSPATDPSPSGTMEPGEPAAADPSMTGRRKR